MMTSFLIPGGTAEQMRALNDLKRVCTTREVVEFYCEYYGPANRAYAALDEHGRAALLADLEALWTQHNKATDGGTKYDGEYLEVIAVREQPEER
jgi:hypothetical protein